MITDKERIGLNKAGQSLGDSLAAFARAGERLVEMFVDAVDLAFSVRFAVAEMKQLTADVNDELCPEYEWAYQLSIYEDEDEEDETEI